MLISDLKIIGSNFRKYRKKLGMTQAQVAEASNLSDRAYADIERGISNTRLETFIKICNVLHITPNEILVDDTDISPENTKDDIMNRLTLCSPQEQKTALQLLYVYLNSFHD